MQQEYNDTIFDDIHPHEEEASYLQRLLTNLTDTVLMIPLFVGIYLLLQGGILASFGGFASVGKYIFILLIVFLYKFLFLTLAGRTPGMMICRVKYLNNELKPLTAREKLLVVFINTSKVRYYKMQQT